MWSFKNKEEGVAWEERTGSPLCLFAMAWIRVPVDRVEAMESSDPRSRGRQRHGRVEPQEKAFPQPHPAPATFKPRFLMLHLTLEWRLPVPELCVRPFPETRFGRAQKPAPSLTRPTLS